MYMYTCICATQLNPITVAEVPGNRLEERLERQLQGVATMNLPHVLLYVCLPHVCVHVVRMHAITYCIAEAPPVVKAGRYNFKSNEELQTFRRRHRGHTENPPSNQIWFIYIGCIKRNDLLNTHKAELIHCDSNLFNLLNLISGIGVSLCGP